MSSIKKHSVVTINQGDPPIRVNPNSIVLSFIAVTNDESEYLACVKDKVEEYSRACQPRLWKVPIMTRDFVFSIEKEIDTGYPNPAGLPSIMEEVGLSPNTSIVSTFATLATDGGRTHFKALIGFAFSDSNPRLIYADANTCIQ